MTDVACFCGCCYSFDGGAGACPQCGEYAVVAAEPALADAGPSRQEQASLRPARPSASPARTT